MRIMLLSLIVLLPGCSTLHTLEPNSLPIELTHVSHVSQHFGSTPTNYGYEVLSIGAKWKPAMNLSISVSEGYNFAPREGQVCAGLCGPREVFTARIAYEIPLK